MAANGKARVWRCPYCPTRPGGVVERQGHPCGYCRPVLRRLRSLAGRTHSRPSAAVERRIERYAVRAALRLPLFDGEG